MEEDLPSEFDLIVLGTGMPESILAAAAARCGKSVLHLDDSSYYGGEWGSFNFDHLNDWAKKSCEDFKNEFEEVTVSHLLKDDEVCVTMPTKAQTNFNIRVTEFIPECNIEDEKAIPQVQNTADSVTEGKELSENVSEIQDCKEVSVEKETHQGDSGDAGNQKVDTKSSEGNTSEKKVWTLEVLHKLKRKFNLDLAPKLLYCRGALVELLIQSNISRYAEFRCSSQILTLLDGNLVPVPCSRADVFSTKHVSIVEKRMLMKFLKFCLDFDDNSDEFKEYENKPFIKFLNSQKLTRNVEHYLIHSIAMVDPNHPTLDSLKKVQKFLQSLGRYGNSPFLFPLYGSGEMPQCFCRLCAVFGGIYCLKRKVDALILNKNSECVAVVVNNKRVNCNFFAMECSYSPQSYLPSNILDKKISKAVFLTDGPMYPGEHDDLTFLRLPSCESFENAISVMELGPRSNVCPEGLRVVYMSCSSKHECAYEDLHAAAQILFNLDKHVSGEMSSHGDKASKPNVLWAMYRNHYDNSVLNLNAQAPTNLFLLPTADIEQDYENAIEKAKEAFSKMFPSEEFLPRAPEPHEIVMDHDGSGDKTEIDTESNLESEESPAEKVESEKDLDKKCEEVTVPEAHELCEPQSNVESVKKCDDTKNVE